MEIETLFAALKTRGFNLEATHMTDPAKLSTLIAILAHLIHSDRQSCFVM
jgi:hypothetical protein